MAPRWLSRAALGLLMCAWLGCKENPTDPGTSAVFCVRACRLSDQAPEGEIFHVEIRSPALIAQAEDLVAGRDHKIVSGTLLRGDGGVNQPWGWHLDPNTVTLSEIAFELCDACPSHIDADPEYWFDRAGQFCPWTTEFVARERGRPVIQRSMSRRPNGRTVAREA